MRTAPLLACIALTACAASARSANPARPPALDVRVIDGDTLEYRGETIRLSNIDAPELPPKAKCWGEAGLAIQAAARAREMLNVSQTFTIEREGKDQYGRTLARVLLRGENDLGEALIYVGAASKWTGRRWDWCGPADYSNRNGVGLSQGPEGNPGYQGWAYRTEFEKP